LVSDILFKGDEDDLLQVYGNGPQSGFFGSFPYLKEYMGDSRLNYQDLKDVNFDDINVDFIDSIYFDTWTEYLEPLLTQLVRRGFNGIFVLGSSAEVYGPKSGKKIPIDEREDLDPSAGAGLHKMEQERILKSFHSLNWVILRYGKIYGPYMDTEDELIYLMVDALTNKDMKVEAPASRTVDLIYVTDIVNLIQRALKSIGISHQIFNVGSGAEYKLPNLARSIRYLVKSDSPIVYPDPPPGFVIEQKGYHTQLNTDKVKEPKYYGFSPIIGTLQGLLQTVRWVQPMIPSEEKSFGAQSIEETYPTLKEEFGKFKLGDTSSTDYRTNASGAGSIEELKKTGWRQPACGEWDDNELEGLS
jgi:nucleoside-diphosphate-sugar epimerase